MFNHSAAASSDVPEPFAHNPSSSGSKRRIGKKLYGLAAIILIIVVVSAFLFSNYSAAEIPLGLNYEVGERMVYETTALTIIERGNQTNNISATENATSNSTFTIEVLSLDDDTYTLNNIYNFDISDNIRTVNLTDQVTKADYVNNFLVGNPARLLFNMSANEYDYYKLDVLQAKVGDTIQIPVNTGNESIGTKGSLTLKFASVENITVPAGTFKVFRIDFKADITIHANTSGLINIYLPEPATGQISGQTYLEYGTCRLIKTQSQETNQILNGDFSYNYTYTSERTLTEFTKP